jgi:hypothetical protein
MLAVEQNGGEYIGWVQITASRVYRNPADDSERIIYADGMRIEFDENVIEIRELE